MAVVYYARFPGWAEQVKRARDWCEDLLTVHSAFDIPGETVASAVLLLSEAVTNAVRYTASGRGGTFDATLMVEQRKITIEVEDEGCPAGGTLPFIRPLTPMAQHGRGMTLVDYLADTWDPLPKPRHGVGFTLTWADRPRPRSAAASA
ncbi:ATP-binding protein [Nocardiopsis sediminis]|uniref:ATP-binding protein n=1 Tax=Nocardiopsis sediminis TaxID=1778267 RepID=A0ABV8FU50_9ACTN